MPDDERAAISARLNEIAEATRLIPPLSERVAVLETKHELTQLQSNQFQSEVLQRLKSHNEQVRKNTIRLGVTLGILGFLFQKFGSLLPS